MFFRKYIVTSFLFFFFTCSSYCCCNSSLLLGTIFLLSHATKSNIKVKKKKKGSIYNFCLATHSTLISNILRLILKTNLRLVYISSVVIVDKNCTIYKSIRNRTAEIHGHKYIYWPHGYFSLNGDFPVTRKAIALNTWLSRTEDLSEFP